MNNQVPKATLEFARNSLRRYQCGELTYSELSRFSISCGDIYHQLVEEDAGFELMFNACLYLNDD